MRLFKLIFCKVLVKIRGWSNTLIADLSADIVNVEGFDGLLKYLKECNGLTCIRLLTKYGASIGEGCRINTGLTVFNADSDFRNLAIGVQVHIGNDTFLDLADKIIIGNRVTISMRSVILTHVDPGSSLLKNSQLMPYSKPTYIGDDSYIGAGVIILPGVKIGKKCIIGSGAVVTKDIKSNSMVKGVPAK